MPKQNSTVTTPRISTSSSNDQEVEFIDEQNLNELAIKNNKVSFMIGNILCSIFLLGISFILIVIGLIIGLGLYFNFENANTLYLNDELALDASTKSSQVQQRINIVEKGCNALVGFLMVKSFPHQLLSFDEFIRFSTVALDINSTSARLYDYAPLIYNADLETFVQQVRNTSGYQLSNFTVYELGETDLIPVNASRAFYFPLLYFYSTTAIDYVGIDTYSVRSDTIDQAIMNTQSIIASTISVLTLDGNLALRLTKAVPGSDSTSIKGIVGSIIMRDELFVDIKNSNMFTYLVIDLNATSLNDSVIYQPDRFPIQQRFSSIDSLLKALQTEHLVQQANLKFGDRNWLFLTIPTVEFISKYSSNTKWFALFGSIFVSFICTFAIILCCIIMVSLYRSHVMTKSRMQIVLLAQTNLKKLVNRIANQEQKSKYILDSIRDCMVVINTVTGKIKTANKSFTLLFQYEEEDWKNLHMASLLPDLVQDFFSNKENQVDEALVVTKAGVQYKARVASTPIPDIDGKYNYSLVVIRLVNDKSDLVIRSANTVYENISGEILQKLKLKESVFYHMFKQFCKQEFTLDTLECIEQIEEYKTIIDVEQRIKKQQQIVNRFFQENAPQQVNMSLKILKKQQQKMSEGLGHLDCFEQTERVLLDSLALNSYSRFMEVYSTLQMQHSSISSMSTSTTSNELELKHKSVIIDQGQNLQANEVKQQ